MLPTPAVTATATTDQSRVGPRSAPARARSDGPGDAGAEQPRDHEEPGHREVADLRGRAEERVDPAVGARQRDGPSERGQERILRIQPGMTDEDGERGQAAEQRHTFAHGGSMARWRASGHRGRPTPPRGVAKVHTRADRPHPGASAQGRASRGTFRHVRC